MIAEAHPLTNLQFCCNMNNDIINFHNLKKAFQLALRIL